MEKELENILKIRFVSIFSPFFYIRSEVWSDNRVCRIDFIITDICSGKEFGIECKTVGGKKGRDLGGMITQCAQYSRLTFGGVRIPIFLYPQISSNYLIYSDHKKVLDDGIWHKDRHDSDHNHHGVNSLLAYFNMGEVRPKKSGDYHDFTFNNKVIFKTAKKWGFNEIVGLHSDNYNELIKRINTWEERSRIFKIIKP